MSIRQGKKLIASSTTNGFSLFDCKWSDHILNNISWLRADTFSWQSGDVYVAAYEHLVADYENTAGGILYAWNNGVGSYVYTLSESPSVGDSVYDSSGVLDSSNSIIDVAGGGIYVGKDEVSSLLYTRDSSRDTKIPQNDTIGNITITYALSEDGHKICLPDQESNLVALYESTGVAWYYILDTTNRQFKLPRTKWGFTGIRSGVGEYVEAGLPNITGSFSTASDKNLGNGAFSWTTNKYATNGGGQGGQWGINFSAKKSNAIYGNSTTVQPPATQMYLYFYVGNFEQSAIEQTAGLNAEMFNDLNAHKVIAFQAPTSANNYTWYRKYADGWVEQGGKFSGNLGIAKTLPITMANTNYQCNACCELKSGHNWDGNPISMYANTTTQVLIKAYGDYTDVSGWWQVSGMAA